MALNWYAVRSKPRKEEVVWRQIHSQGFEVYYPRIRVNPVNPRSKRTRPYFPGYLFVQADLDLVGVSFFQWMPHSIGLVCFGGEPSAVPENLIQTLKQRLDQINAAGGEVFAGLKPGDSILISDGPFKGYEAIFDAQLDGNERVRVLLEFLGSKRKVAVTLHAGQIEKKRNQQQR